MAALSGALYLGAALTMNTLAPVMTKITQNESGGYSYNKWCVYFFAELIKLTVASCWSWHLKRTDPSAASKMTLDTKESIRYVGPAFFFFCQNNLSFIALMYLSNSAFQLLLNCRIVMVAISTTLVLGKPINSVEWVAVILLTTGAVQYNLSGCEPGELRVNMVGVLVMLLIAASAAGGNVYTQLVMQKKMDQPLMFQNAQLYAYGVVFNGINWGLSMGVTSDSSAFGELGYKPVLAMLFYALYGLCISVILKRFGAMVRTFVNALAIVFNSLIDASFFGSPITLSDVTCFSVILCATFLYGNLAKDYKPPAGTELLPMGSDNDGAETPKAETPKTVKIAGGCVAFFFFTMMLIYHPQFL